MTAAKKAARAVSWEPVRQLAVYYQDDAAPVLVGELGVGRDGRVHFQYDPTWVARGIELSPRHLGLEVGLAVVPAPSHRKLHGLHGLFADTLPDAWGMRVQDHAFLKADIPLARVGPLDRLAYLGDRTMGALTYRPSRISPRSASAAASLDELARSAQGLQDQAVASVTASGPRDIDILERAGGGSAGGAQPKVLIAVSPDGTAIATGSETPAGYLSHILKFTPKRDGLGLRTDAGVLEEAYAVMARAAGISMPRTSLLTTSDGRRHFAVERFDRTAIGGRRHVHSLGGLLGKEAADDEDYDMLIRLVRSLSSDERLVQEVFRRLCFNLLALNDDDHLKNTSFLLDPVQGWTLSPAYDLTYSPARAGRGMSVLGREGDVTWEAVMRLADRHGVSRGVIGRIRDDVSAAVAHWPIHASGTVSPEAVLEIQGAMDERRLSLETVRQRRGR